MKTTILFIFLTSLPTLSPAQHLTTKNQPDRRDVNALTAFYNAGGRRMIKKASSQFTINGKKPASRYDVYRVIPENAGTPKKYTMLTAQTGRVTTAEKRFRKARANNAFDSQLTSSKLNIYPHPINAIKSLSLKPHEGFELVIKDLSGNELLRQVNPCSIDFVGFDKGVYLLSIIANTGIRQMRVIKK